MNRIGRMFCISCLTLCLALAFVQGSQARQEEKYKAQAVEFLATHGPQLEKESDPVNRFYMLLKLTPAAMYAGDAEKATAYARDLLALGEQLKSQPGNGPSLFGDATHVGNTVLGLLALTKGEVNKAKEYLLASARGVPGSPVLISFGPSMLLAEELLKKGEREVVIEYFDLCEKFWENDYGNLARWKSVVKAGNIPEFGPHRMTHLTGWRRRAK